MLIFLDPTLVVLVRPVKRSSILVSYDMSVFDARSPVFGCEVREVHVKIIESIGLFIEIEALDYL